jgi:hypothetical protein
MVNSWLFLLGGDRFYFGDDIAEVIDRVGLTVSLVVVVVFVALFAVYRRRVRARATDTGSD